jgi:hypothetical protein
MQGSWETWALPEGAGLPMMVSIGLMGGLSLMGVVRLIEILGLTLKVLVSSFRY